MLILSIDTSSNLLSIALLKEGAVLAHQEAYMERGQGEALIPAIADLFLKAKSDISSLNAVAVGVGPGSFTGVRVGLSAARGIGMALDIPVYGVTSFEAFSFGMDINTLVALDTKRGDYYTQAFKSSLQPLGTPIIQTAAQIQKQSSFYICSDVAQKMIQEISLPVHQLAEPLAVQVAKVALSRLDNPLPPEPLYLRDADVTLS